MDLRCYVGGVTAGIRIAPSILSADFARLGEELAAVTEAGADLIHIDVMDGHFVPNITIGPLIVEAAKRSTRLPLDVHLMIENADLYLEDFIKAGASSISVSAEACTHLHRTIQRITNLGAKASVALNPGTPLSAIEYVLSDLSMVLLMTVNPGFGGQEFIEGVLPKIEKLRKMAPDLDIQVDGGIKTSNIDKVVRAGANIVVSGSGIFKSKDYKITVAEMKQRAEAARVDVIARK